MEILTAAWPLVMEGRVEPCVSPWCLAGVGWLWLKVFQSC